MTDRINAGEGSLGQLLKDDALAKSLTVDAGNLDQVTGRLKRGDNTAGKLLTEKELYDRFNSLAAQHRRADRGTSRRGRAPPASCCTTSSCMTI